VRESSAYRQTIAAALEAAAIIRDAIAGGRLALPPREIPWLNRIDAGLQGLPGAEADLLAEMTGSYGHLFSPKSYGL
jgi:hypothetical protein